MVQKTETVQDIGAFEERLSKSGNDDLDRVVKATVDNVGRIRDIVYITS